MLSIRTVDQIWAKIPVYRLRITRQSSCSGLLMLGYMTAQLALLTLVIISLFEFRLLDLPSLTLQIWCWHLPRSTNIYCSQYSIRWHIPCDSISKTISWSPFPHPTQRSLSRIGYVTINLCSSRIEIVLTFPQHRMSLVVSFLAGHHRSRKATIRQELHFARNRQLPNLYIVSRLASWLFHLLTPRYETTG